MAKRRDVVNEASNSRPHDSLAGGAAPKRWSREVVTTESGGYPVRVYFHRPRSLSELLVDARRWGERTFIIEGELRISFARHEAAVARVAQHLAGQRIGRGDRVLLLGYNSAEWLVAFWALQSLDAIAVLGNAWWSDDETAAALALIEPTAVLTDRSGERAIAHHFNPQMLEALRAIIDDDGAVPVLLRPVKADEDDPALIMFSSGTTGSAKGVVMSHRAVIANIQNLLVLTGRLPDEISTESAGTVSLLTVPLFHLAGVQISFSTLLSGGSLVFLEGRFDPATVLALIAREKVRVWGSIPTMVARVIDHPRFADYDTSSVRSIPMGGAAVSPELRAKVQQAFPATQKRVGSLYGLTEAGGVLAAGSADDVQGRPGCVGRALPVVELKIANVDATGVGEIVARTPTIASGYWRDATPIADAQGWVKTGDLGRLDDNGYLYVTGRSKDIIIRGGENIASAHVERCLMNHPAVKEVAVVALPHKDLGEEVGAAVVLRVGATATIDDLRRHALSHLAKFEVPSNWWIRHQPLPTNASGKVVKRAVQAAWAGAQDQT